jgi:hypothetical protein
MLSGKLRNIDRFVDRHGKLRTYYRFGRGRRIRLPNDIESLEFLEAYDRAAEAATTRVTSNAEAYAVFDAAPGVPNSQNPHD